VSVLTVRPGATYRIDPSEKRVIQFDWDAENLAAGVTVTSTFTITGLKVASGVALLTKDNEIVLSGNRKTQVRLDATTATLGDLYELANTVTTNESPAQIKQQSIRVLVENG
jgi:hypothetical protein